MTFYIFNKKLPNNQPLNLALMRIFGVGLNTAKKICRFLGVNQTIKVSYLTSYQKYKLKSYLTKELILEFDHQKRIKQCISTMAQIKNKRFMRKHVKQNKIR